MSPQQIIIVGLRLIALLWTFHVVSHSYELFSYANVDATAALSKSSILAFALLQLGIAAIFWFFPATIAAKLLRSGSQSEESVSPSLQQWQVLGFICIGVWSLCRAIPDAMYWTTVGIMANSSDVEFSSFSIEQKASVVSTILEIVIGLWLVLGAKGLAVAIYKLRTTGVSK
jgi:hypothetical protein